MDYETNERNAYIWFKENYDPAAEYKGGHDSTVSDIYSPKFQCFVEVKMIDTKSTARCGQFVEKSVSANPYVDLLQKGMETIENLKGFVRYHYSEKNVRYFIVGIENFSLLSIEEFLEQTIISLAKPYKKRSGTHSCSKGISLKLIELDSEFELVDNKPYCINQNRFGEIFVYDNKEFFISGKNNGEIRSRGKAPEKNTYHIEVKLK